MTDSTASALSGEGVPAAPAAPAPSAPVAVAPVTPAAPAWLEGADETTVGYVQNKGWQEPKQVLEGYRNLEKLLGADKAGNAVVLPKADAPKAELDAFYSRLGRPADAAGYGLEKIAGSDPEFSKVAGGWFHEVGLTSKQAAALVEKFNGHVGGAATAGAEAQAAAFQADESELKSSWGGAYNQNVAAAQAAVRGLGLDAATIDKLSASLGHKATMEFFHKIGSKVGEADFVSGDNLEKFGNALTPGQAKARIQELMTDKAFTARYLNKDADAKAEMERLHKFAYPE